ncbi:MAG TPA: hypothetical protein EYQ60_15870 [Myxococcales bacterium]|nr:hypothetical protein [Myxococcales bacterium]HIK85122.1 hypothetical protein [Myxococcales bacterium]
MSDSTIRFSVDRSRCVICGGPNDCALAGADANGDKRDAPCWCVEETFPTSLLDVANARDGGASCICRHCLEKDVSAIDAADRAMDPR